MQIERILYPVETLGVGKRLVIWTVGCSKRCEHCISPEMWECNPEKDIPIHKLVRILSDIINENDVDGVTISGGDPLEQAEELLELVSAIHTNVHDILVYTGYTYEELQDILPRESMKRLTDNIAVLIDGRYIHEKNDGLSPLRGSTNQIIHFFNEKLRPLYEEYMKTSGRKIQNVFYGNQIISVGIHGFEGN
jgi:anaerobic ribonucleoside-triphosphate reductase activating protein